MILKKHKQLLLSVAFLVPALVFSGCAVRHKGPPLVTVEGTKGHFFRGRIVSLDKGKAVSFERLINDLGKKDLVFIGEVHDNPEHHLIQVQILQALMAGGGPWDIAMEFFDETQQPALDRYMKGDLSEEEFLRLVEWEGRLRAGYHYYRPLVLTARAKGKRLLGINAPREVVKKVARSGLSSLKEAQRELVASSIDLDNTKHRSYVKEAYKRHSHRELKKFEFFYQAQCVWEETMAENIADYLTETRGRLVVFTGNGHIINKFGIPDRTMRRRPADMVTVLLQPVEQGMTIKKGLADYVWLTGRCAPHR